jgi:hypothetical protein
MPIQIRPFALVILSLSLGGCASAPADESVGTEQSSLADGKGPRCQIFIRCAPGWEGADTDGDGCLDTCVRTECPTYVRCAPGWHAADTDGDGCADTCAPD